LKKASGLKPGRQLLTGNKFKKILSFRQTFMFLAQRIANRNAKKERKKGTGKERRKKKKVKGKRKEEKRRKEKRKR